MAQFFRLKKVGEILFDTLSRRQLSKYPLKPLLPKSMQPSDLKSIVLVSNTALGDTLISSPSFKAIRESFPQAYISLFIHKNIYPLFSGLECIDDFIIYKSGLSGYESFFSNIKEIASKKPDLIFHLHSNGPQDVQISILSKCPHIIKVERSNKFKFPLSYNQLPIPNTPNLIERLIAVCYLRECYSLESFIAPKEALLKGEASSYWSNGVIYCSRDKISMILPNRYLYLQKHSSLLCKDSLKIGFQVKASKAFREWGVDNFTQLAKEILQSHPKLQIFLTGSKKEFKDSQAIITALPSFKNRIINECGKYSLSELPYFLSNLDLLVTNDTGPMHLAATLKTPTLALFVGGPNPNVTGIIQDIQLHKTLFAPQPNDLSVAKVYETFKEHLQNLYSLHS